MRDITDEVYVVTGGAGAIAKPVVHALAAAGARVVVADLDQGRADARAAEIGDRGFGLAVDLSKADGAAAMVAAAEAKFGLVDGLVHTAGGFAMGPLVEQSPEAFDKMFDVNVRTLFYAVRAAVPPMVSRERGFVCAFGSAPAMTGRAPGSALYGAAKSAVATLMHSLAEEVGKAGVHVCVVHPMGAVDTPANRRDMPGVDEATLIDPEDIADTIVHAARRSDRGRMLDLAVWP